VNFLDQHQRLLDDDHLLQDGHDRRIALKTDVRGLGDTNVAWDALDLEVVAHQLLGNDLFAFFDGDMDPDAPTLHRPFGDRQPLFE
jgi:hypothetical protein